MKTSKTKRNSLFKSFRMISLTATGTPWLATVLATFALSSKLNWGHAFLSLLGILILQLGVNLMNDVSDFKRGIDNENEFGGSGVLVSNELSSRFLSGLGIIFFILSVLIVLYLISQNGDLLIISLLGAVCAIFYSLPFFGLKYIALGDVAVFIGCGPVLCAGYALAMGELLPEHIYLGIFYGLYAVGILHTNNMEDITIDTSKNVKTLANILGFESSKKVLILVYAVGSLSLLLLGLKGNIGFAPFFIHLLATPLASGLIKSFLKAKYHNDKSLKLLRVKAAQLHLAAGVLVCIGLGLSLWR